MVVDLQAVDYTVGTNEYPAVVDLQQPHYSTSIVEDA